MYRWIAIAGLVGCAGAKIDDQADKADPTWYGDVAPVLIDKCADCHQDGGLGVFSMDSYEEVQPWASAINDAIASGRMPPWAATETDECTQEVPFKDDPRLSDAEKEMVRRWVDAGAPAGKPRAVEVPPLRELADPTTVVRLQEPFEVAGNRDIYQCFRIEVPHDQDVYITDLEVKPDNGRVVHHVLVWNDPENQSLGRAGPDGSYPCSGEPDIWPTDMLGGWAPGQPPTHNPEGTGTLFKAGASIVVNVHYHPTDDSTEFDQTEIAIKWTTEKPANYVTYYLVDIPFGAQLEAGPHDEGGPRFRIPAGMATHREKLTFDPYRYIPLPIDLPIFAIMPHMHYRGTEMRVQLKHETGDNTCLLEAKDYRFDFQQNYTYDVTEIDQMPTMQPGDVMKIRCTYDNSWNNPFMEEALAASGADDLFDVYWGEETGDEMCMAAIGLVIPPIDITEFF